MTLINQIFGELAGMFFGDTRLSLMMLAVVVAAALVALAGAPLAAGAVLLAGSLAALFESVLRAGHRL